MSKYKINMEFVYLDGCNNHYRISPDLLIYDPMKPINSSSGTYDGGEPQTLPIDAATFEEIKTVMMAAFEAVSEHIDARRMGSGLLKMQEDNERASCILDMNSAYKAAIDAVLQAKLKH